MEQGPPDILRRHREDILEIAARHGARNVRAFGSRARGDAGPASDLDLLVAFDEGRSLMDQVALKQDLEDLLGVRVDIVDEPALYHAIRERVLSEAVPV